MSFSWRKMKDNISSVCNDYDNIIVMVSGGVDSMFLVDFVSNIGLNIIVAHFQHGIRDDDYREVELVRSFAEKNNHKFILGKGVDLKGAKNLEALARNQRWEFIESEIEKLSGRTIVLTAHHHDDQIESIFMRLVRGYPLQSLTMKEIIDFGNYTKFKPLLHLTKEQIIGQAKRRRIESIDDPTNQSTDLSCERNYWRNVLIPQILTIRNVNKSLKPIIKELAELDKQKGDERVVI